MEKIEILEVLNDWNYWKKELPLTHSRSDYDDKIASFLKKDEVVVIKGVRRSGKSTLLLNQIRLLLQDGIDTKNILFVNLEDPRFANHLSLDFLSKIKDVYLEYIAPSQKPYIFLDEIQNIPEWEKWVNKEYELKLSKIAITGSNSSMLSGEIASVLSGRYLSVDVYPLSFGEYLGFVGVMVDSHLDLVDKKIEINRAFESFLKDGGFPKVVEYPNAEKRELLSAYKDSILLKDIVARYKLKNFQKLEEITAFLLANSGTTQSITKIKNSFGTSFDMASDYIEYLKNSYMLKEVKKFDYSPKKQGANDKKYYSIDLGLSNLYRVANLKFRGSDIESIVYLELLRRGYKVFYYKTSSNLEIDFVLQKDNEIVELVQVSKSIEDVKTLKREIEPFARAMSELNLQSVKTTIITEDKSRMIKNGEIEVSVVNIIEWLTGAWNNN